VSEFVKMLAYTLISLPAFFGILFFALFLIYRNKLVKKSRQFDRAKSVLIRLRLEKRITNEEYEEALAQRPYEIQRELHETPIATAQVASPQTSPVKTAQVASPQPVFLKPTPAKEIHSSPQVTQLAPAQVQMTPEDFKPFNAMNVLLIVGVIFIVLAGAVFTTTTWLYLHPILRLLVICSTSMVFFAASALAEKALNIPKTGMSFFTIASIFLPISVIGVGFFKLLGGYFSLDGDGKYLVFMVASVVLAVACWIGAGKYKKFFFAEAFLYCVTASYLFFLASFHMEKKVFILLLYVYAALLIVLGNFVLSRKKKQQPLSFVAQMVPTFSVINAVAIAVLGSVVSGSGLLAGIPVILFAPLFLTALFRGENAYAGTIPFAVMLTMGFVRLNTGGLYINSILLAVLAVAIISVIGTLNLFPEKMQKWLSVIAVSISGIIFILLISVIGVFNEWTLLQLLAVLGLFVSLVFLAYRSKQPWVRFTLPIIAVTLITGATSLFTNQDMNSCAMISLLSTVFFFGFVYADKKLEYSPRTVLSDLLFSGWCLSGVIISLDGVWQNSPENSMLKLVLSLAPFLLLTMVLVFLSLEKDKKVSSIIAAASIPAVFFMSGFPLYQFCNPYFNGAWILLLMYFVLASGSLLAQKNRNRLQALNVGSISGLATMIVFGLGLVLFFVTGNRLLFVPGIAWIFTAYLFARIAWTPKDESVLNNAHHFSRHYVFAGAAFYLAIALTAKEWFSIDSMFGVVLFPAITALIFSAAGPLSRFRGIKILNVFQSMEQVGSYGLTIFSALLAIAFFGEKATWLIIIVVLFLVASVFFQYKQGRAYLSAWFEMLMIYVAAIAFINKFEGIDIEGVSVFVYSGLFVILAALGRLFHKSVFDTKDDSAESGGKQIDWLSLSSVLSPIALLFIGRYARWEALIFLFIYSLNFLGRVQTEESTRIAKAAAGFFLMLSLWSQPLFDIPNIIILEYYLLAFVGYLVFINQWVYMNKTTSQLLFVAACTSFLILGCAAIISADVVDALILGITAFAMLAVSFYWKRKRWFILAAVTLLVLAFYMTREFWSILDWWVYLLMVGLLLIGMAATNEISKKNGETLSEKARRLFEDWD